MCAALRDAEQHSQQHKANAEGHDESDGEQAGPAAAAQAAHSGRAASQQQQQAGAAQGVPEYPGRAELRQFLASEADSRKTGVKRGSWSQDLDAAGRSSSAAAAVPVSVQQQGAGSGATRRGAMAVQAMPMSAPVGAQPSTVHALGDAAAGLGIHSLSFPTTSHSPFALSSHQDLLHLEAPATARELQGAGWHSLPVTRAPTPTPRPEMLQPFAAAAAGHAQPPQHVQAGFDQPGAGGVPDAAAAAAPAATPQSQAQPPVLDRRSVVMTDATAPPAADGGAGPESGSGQQQGPGAAAGGAPASAVAAAAVAAEQAQYSGVAGAAAPAQPATEAAASARDSHPRRESSTNSQPAASRPWTPAAASLPQAALIQQMHAALQAWQYLAHNASTPSTVLATPVVAPTPSSLAPIAAASSRGGSGGGGRSGSPQQV